MTGFVISFTDFANSKIEFARLGNDFVSWTIDVARRIVIFRRRQCSARPDPAGPANPVFALPRF